jgi:cupin fold WbuC family metalloprotein
MRNLQLIDRGMLDAISAQARAAPRLRLNRNIHASEREPCNRLLNAIEPGSYVQPHRHDEPTKDETVAVIRGRLGVIAFDDAGRVTEQTVLEPDGERMIVTIPCGVFHTFLALEPGTVFFEAKAGPYRPLQPEEKAAWAPAENRPEVPAYRAALASLFRNI